MTLLETQVDLRFPPRTRKKRLGSSARALKIVGPLPVGMVTVEPSCEYRTGVSDTIRVQIDSQSEVVHERRRFRLNRLLQTKRSHTEDVWIVESVEVGILGYGHSQTEAEQSFSAQFAATWDSIASEDDALLTRDAQELKKLYLSIVSKVIE